MLTMLATITVLALPPRESGHNKERGISSAKQKQTKKTKKQTIKTIRDKNKTNVHNCRD